jgi:hypothetical protein
MPWAFVPFVKYTYAGSFGATYVVGPTSNKVTPPRKNQVHVSVIAYSNLGKAYK